MAIKQKANSNKKLSGFKNIEKIKIGIVVSEWNSEITNVLCDGALDYLKKQGIPDKNVIVKRVPGSFELPLAAQWFFEHQNVDAVACLGCIIKGETPHFHYISEAVFQQIARLNTKYSRPVGFGIITAETEAHAIDRAGGNKGNKGEEAADAILKMILLKEDIAIEKKKELGF